MARAARRWNSGLFAAGMVCTATDTSIVNSVGRSFDRDRHFVRVEESLFIVT